MYWTPVFTWKESARVHFLPIGWTVLWILRGLLKVGQLSVLLASLTLRAYDIGMSL